MSQLEVDKIIPQSGTTLTIGDSGDTITISAGATLSGSLNADNLDSGTVPDGRITGAYTGITNLTMSGDLTVDTNTLKVDSANNRVGIGTSSPNTNLDIRDTGANNGGTLTLGTTNDTTGGDYGAIQFYKADPSGAGAGVTASITATDGANSGANSELVFATGDSGIANTERMRIDSSGTLLVGTTSGSINDVGSKIFPSGTIVLTRSGNAPLFLNRQTSDGDIAIFHKDQTEVGSINARAGDLTIGTGITGITFTDSIDAIRPVKVSDDNLTDNTTDIGSASNRFQDLYLGGGLYVGGTGTANKLDDYEEGSFSTNISGNLIATTKTVVGDYVKIGEVVYLQALVTVSGKTGGSGNGYFNLPFNPKAGFGTFQTGGTIYKQGIVSASFLGLYGTTAQVYPVNSSGNAISIPNWSDGTMGFTLTYLVQ